MIQAQELIGERRLGEEERVVVFNAVVDWRKWKKIDENRVVGSHDAVHWVREGRGRGGHQHSSMA